MKSTSIKVSFSTSDKPNTVDFDSFETLITNCIRRRANESIEVHINNLMTLGDFNQIMQETSNRIAFSNRCWITPSVINFNVAAKTIDLLNEITYALEVVYY